MSKIQRNVKKQSQPQEFMNWTTPRSRVVAKPVETFVQTPASDNAMRVLEALDRVGSISHKVSHLKGTLDKKNYEKGEDLYNAGLSPEEDAARKTIEAYEHLKGEAAAEEYSLSLYDYHKNNVTKDPETYQAGLDGLYDQFTAGRSRHWLRTFVPNAEKLHTQYVGHYKKFARDEFEKNTLAEASKVIDLVVSMEKSPEWIREQTSLLQENMSRLGISKSQVSMLVAEKLIMQATEHLDKDVLEALNLKDKDGIAIINNPQVEALVNDARDSIDDEIDSNFRMEEWKADKAAQQFHNDFLFRIDEVRAGSGEESFSSIGKELDSKRSILRSHYKTLKKYIRDLESGAISGPSDPDTLQDVKLRLYKDKEDRISMSELDSCYERGLISTQDYGPLASTLFQLDGADEKALSGSGRSQNVFNSPTYKIYEGKLKQYIPKVLYGVNSVDGPKWDSTQQTSALLSFKEALNEEGVTPKDIPDIFEKVVIKQFGGIQPKESLPPKWQTQIGVFEEWDNPDRGYDMDEEDVLQTFHVLTGKEWTWGEAQNWMRKRHKALKKDLEENQDKPALDTSKKVPPAPTLNARGKRAAEASNQKLPSVPDVDTLEDLLRNEPLENWPEPTPEWPVIPDPPLFAQFGQRFQKGMRQKSKYGETPLTVALYQKAPHLDLDERYWIMGALKHVLGLEEEELLKLLETGDLLYELGKPSTTTTSNQKEKE